MMRALLRRRACTLLHRATASPVLLAILIIPAWLSVPALAQMGGGMTGGAMPDLSQMAGQPIPVPDLPTGTVTVRVVRQQMTNVVADQEVELQVGNEMRPAKTDATGRATFSGLTPGTQVRAFTEVDGEKLMSVPFEIGATGGARVLLAAGLEQAAAERQKAAEAAAKAPPVKGTVVFGGNSQLVFEFQDDGLSAFYLLEIVNTARVPVDLGGPLVFDVPRAAVQTSLLEESTKQASVSGTRVTVTGPFAPGTTPLQIAFRLPHSSSTLDVTQAWPVALQGLTVIVQKVGGDMHIASPQFAQTGERQLQAGLFLVGTGGALSSGQTLAMTISGLPHESTWPRDLALGAAIAIILAGFWLARGGGNAEALRAQLRSRRDRLFNELVALEEQHRAGRIDARAYEQRRQTLMQQLERVYGELDTTGGPATRGGGEGLAA